MANGIFVIQKQTNAVIAIKEECFNPTSHSKLASPHGDPWAVAAPPVVPARDIVSLEGEKPTPSEKKVVEEEEEEVKAPAKKRVSKKGKK